MGLDETLFGLFYRAAQRALQRNPAQDSALGSVSFAELSAELSIVAAAVAERRVVLVASVDEGAIRSPRIELPKRIALGTQREHNTQCYLARVVFDATTLRLGLALDTPGANPSQRLLATLLVAPAVSADLEVELPGARALVASVCAQELLTRPQPNRLDPSSAALEALLQLRLGRILEADDLPKDAAALAWVARASECAPRTRSDLRDALAALWPFVRTARVAPLSVWGGIDAASQTVPELSVGDQSAQPARSARRDKPMRARPNVRRVELPDDEIQENPLLHSFEKLHTADEYKGGSKRADGSDEIAEHGAALDELEIGELTRTNQTAAAFCRADLTLEGDIDDAADGGDPAEKLQVIPYDEWDERAQRYRPNWCNVYAVPASQSQTVSAAEARERVAAVLAAQRRELRELSAELSRLRNARSWRNRQPDGPDVDVDAMIDRYGALRSGHCPTDKLYVSRRRHNRGLAVLLLVDASLSTDSWIAGFRVLDVAKSALIVLGEVFGAEEVPTAIATFSSQTRKRCNFSLIKQFDEAWESAQRRIVAIEPAGYTRIGPALRHASKLLSEHPAHGRLLLLISDAKPTDYDRYEGRYGNGDVRKAISEAQSEGISVFALAIDGRIAEHLPSMFQRGRYQLLARPQDLARALTEVYAELLR